VATYFADDRESALRVGYEANEWTMPIDWPTYRKVCESWLVLAIQRDGETIGAFFLSPDGEGHTAIVKPWRRRWATKSIVRQLRSMMRFTQIAQGHEQKMGSILRRMGMTQNGNRWEFSHGD